MATTRLSDVVIPEIYMDYTSYNSPEKTAFFESGIVVSNSLLNQKANSANTIAHLPFWNDLDASVAPNISSDDPAQIAVPQKTGATQMLCRVGYYNQGWSDADLVSEISGEDPMTHIRNRTGRYWQRVWQKKLIQVCLGVLADNIANDSGDMLYTAGGVFTRAAFTSAVFTLGDSAEQLKGIAVHSAVLKQMVDNDDIEYIMDSDGKTQIPYYMGKRVIVDDGLPAASTTVALGTVIYTSILFGEGAIGYGNGNPEMPVEIEREAAQGNGAGVETLWERKTWIIHPLGFSFTSASVAGQSPTNAELATAANWDRKYQRKSIPMAFLRTTLTVPTP